MPGRAANASFFALSLALLPLTHGSPASASEARLDLVGQVPILCRAEVDLGGGPGQMNEFCNDLAGYDVYLDHGPLPAPASVTIDGSQLALADAASTLISSSDRASIRTRSIRFDVPAGARLVVRVVPR
jgi:hypothetical protein